MKLIFSFRSCYLIFAGPALSAVSVYFILSNLLLFPYDIAITLSVILFSLLLGLSSYLQVGKDDGKKERNDFKKKNNGSYASSSYDNKEFSDKRISPSNLIFIAVYILSILIVGTSKPLSITGDLFIAWEQFFTSPTLLIQLVAAVLLSFFFPGYALVYLLVKVYPLGSLPKLLLSFLFSMLIAGFSVYVAAIMIGVPVAYLKPIIIGVDVLVLILFIIYNKTKKTLSFDLDTIVSSFSQAVSKFRITVTTKNIASFSIFASLFALVVFYTCYIEKGVIVGDQWFHHGRALLINSGTFKDFATSDAGQYYPPFFSSLLAGFFSVSGIPSVNAYVSANVLNMMVIFAFYYFFSRWVPSNQRKAAVLATTLFMLSSGFGWVLVLNSSLTSNYYYSQESSLENLHIASIRSSDIRTPITFINVGHPTFTSPLIIIGLPAGFVLLGLIKERIANIGKLRFICIITMITVLGILSHPEFYLFIIVGSILILSFRLNYGNLIYASIMFALFFCFLINFLSPQNYYTSIKILNIPLLILCLIFVSIVWALYRTRIFSKLYGLISFRDTFPLTKIVNSSSKKVVRIVIISVLAYMYLFSFIVLQALSIDDIQIQVGTSTQRNIPWYLYPVKFGVAGLLGLAFIVSYLFKRYEKETFVFGIIAVVSLFIGPYYDEHRFSKYIMVGMVGFASILVYKIILFLQRPDNYLHHHSHATTSQLKPLAYSILIGAVVTSAALSVFMLAGYKVLGYKNPQFQEDFFRIDFPSQSELKLLNFFRADLPYLNTKFISIRANDSQTEKIFSELEGFSAIPRHRILQNPQSLNASTLQGLYYSLDNDNIKYIILLKTDAHSEQEFPKPIQFALDNFQRVYQDDIYVILKVPDLSPPLSESAADIGLVYNKRNEIPSLSAISNDTNNSNTNIFQYDYKFFNNIENSSEFIKIEKKMNGGANESKSKIDETDTLTLYADNKPKTLWSNLIKGQNIVNYVEGKFRLLAENKTKNDVGIRMEDDTNSQQYHVSLDKDSLKLRQKLNLENMSNKERVIAQNPQLPAEQRGLWNTLKILVLKDTIYVYLNDILKIKASKSLFAENFNSISKIGISANENIVQFEPLKIGYLSKSVLESYQQSNIRETYYQYYYPLSALALAKLRYDTFMDGDFSIFSKKNVILTSDPKLDLDEDVRSAVEEDGNQDRHVISEKKFNSYLEFAKSGGTLIVMNPDSNSKNYNKSKSEQGTFSKFLSLRYGDKIKFNGIVIDSELRSLNISDHHNFINISGVATNIELSNSSDIDVKSYYVNVNKDNNSNNKPVAPFAIEKKYGKGKIVLVNIAGYFDSLLKTDNQEFITIRDIPKMIDLETDIHDDTLPRDTTIFAGTRIKGDMKISNHTGVTTKSSSLLLNSINSKAPFYNLTINNISMSPLMPINASNSNYPSNFHQKYLNESTAYNQNNILNNITIRDLKIFGPYEAIINSTKLLNVSPGSSYYDYTTVLIPNGFDMSLKLSQGAYVEFTLISCTNNSHCEQRIRISDVGDLSFHKIKVDSQLVSSLPVFVKSPEIMIINGTVKFNVDSNINNLAQPSGNIVTNGNIVANFDHVESYTSINNNEIRTDFVTYLKSLDIDGNYVREERESDTFRLPGEVSERAKDKGIGVPWQTTMMSFTSIIIIISIIFVVIVLKYYLWPKIKQYKELTK